MAASRRSQIDPFHVMEVMRAAEERVMAGGEVLHLEVGQPSTPAPAAAIEAAKQALDAERLGYTPAKGIPRLRERIARRYADRHGVEVSPDHVIVTVGASGGFSLAFLSAFDVGDRVAVSAPGYPCYRNVLEAFGIEAVVIPVDASTRFNLTPALLAEHGPLDGVLVASPANPTGTILTPRELEALVGHCSAHGIRVIADEIYHGITFTDQPVQSLLEHDRSGIVLQSFSKYWSMTGWRVGWVVAPDDLVQPMERLKQNLFISAPTIGQVAALAALDADEELEANVARYAANRPVVLGGLAAMGCTTVAPADGAFYAYADISHLGRTASSLCETWLDDLGVAVTPGIDFDPLHGEDFIRISFSESTEDVTEAMRRLVGWVGDR
ncbi:MAG: aminotransferase class I/II-fold pyridoxal phosphate-dependent enzyme [Acidimicrobiia bacterium]|nr:MAG: aminotransferase class I/II-fold pyridoxal phosphate-dependent enzyme [Acidimicrobiia bacterium]